MPAVVQIQRIPNGKHDMGISELENFFLPENRAAQNGRISDERTLGTGFIIRSDGYIVTSSNLLLNAREIHVILADGSRLPATVVGNDLDNHVALLKIDADRLSVVSINPQVRFQPGQVVFAIGSPMDVAFHHSVSLGIVSAVDNLGGGGAMGPNWLTDATLSPGNSGGPLFDRQGEFVGMAYVPWAHRDTPAGLSMVLSPQHVDTVVQKLIAGFVDPRVQLGIQFIPSQVGDVATAQEAGAARVVQVAPGSSAYEAGLLKDDIILAVDDTLLQNYLDLSEVIKGKSPGEVVTLTVLRGEDAINMQIRLKEWVSDFSNLQNQFSSNVANRDPGFFVGDLTKDLVQDLDVPVGEGVVVLYVDTSSKAYREGGIRSGMVMVSLAGQPIKNVKEFNQQIESLERGRLHFAEFYRPRSDASFLTAILTP